MSVVIVARNSFESDNMNYDMKPVNNTIKSKTTSYPSYFFQTKIVFDHLYSTTVSTFYCIHK